MKKLTQCAAVLLTSAAIFVVATAGTAERNTVDSAPMRVGSGAGRYSTLADIDAEVKMGAVTTEPAKVEPVIVEEPTSLGTFKLTAYCPCPKCCGEWADGVTYTGTEATAGRTIAVDPTVIPLGTTVHINGQAYTAEDIGGAIKGNRIDVYFPTHTEALQFGVQYAEVAIN